MLVDLITFDTAGQAFAALRDRACDVGFLAIDPARAAELAFTAPYVVIEGTYIVPRASALTAVLEVDRKGVRIAAGRNTAYDLHLSRALKRAELVYAPNSQAALEMFVAEKLEAAAGVRQPLLAFAAAHPDLRVLEDRFMVIEQAMATPKDRQRGAGFLRAYIERMKGSGFVAASLSASGQADVRVPTPEAPPARG